MNTAQLKALSWGSALIFGGALAAYVGHYLANRTELEKRVQPAEIQAKLAQVDVVQKPKEDIVDYEKVHQALYKYNWLGKPPPPPPPPVVVEAPKPPSDQPVASLVKVLLVKSDRADPAESRAVLKYQPAAKVTLKDPTVVKHVGDTLDAPNQGILIAAILPEGVRFSFKDSQRAEELVQPNEFQNRLDMEFLAGNKGVLLQQPTVSFPRSSTFGELAERTYQENANSYVIGTEDMAFWEENYASVLAEVDRERHRDPVTGKYDGITLTKVPPGSVAAQHGAQDGDVIKSINGHPVSTEQEAIAFVKNNKDKYDVWEIEIESKGKTKTITYKVPKKK